MNVYAPLSAKPGDKCKPSRSYYVAFAHDRLVPVLVYIHGGGKPNIFHYHTV